MRRYILMVHYKADVPNYSDPFKYAAAVFPSRKDAETAQRDLLLSGEFDEAMLYRETDRGNFKLDTINKTG